MHDADLITSFEAGLLLGKSARTVQRMAGDDLPIAQKLPGPNGAYLFRRRDVEAYKAHAVALAIGRGACPACSTYGCITFHNADPCPNEPAVAS